MKCTACGYEKEWDIDDNGNYVSIGGDKDFIHLNVNVTRECGDYYKHETKVSLYACPECNTVIAQL